jgi:hypothetical protein
VLKSGTATQDTFIREPTSVLVSQAHSRQCRNHALAHHPRVQDQNTKDHRNSYHSITKAGRAQWSTDCRSTLLQELWTHRQSSLPLVLQTLNSVSNQGVDIQLKILQALLSILTYNADAHGDILGNVGVVTDQELILGSAPLFQATRCSRIGRILHRRRNAATSSDARF